jgi:hypothetical protein
MHDGMTAQDDVPGADGDVLALDALARMRGGDLARSGELVELVVVESVEQGDGKEDGGVTRESRRGT